MKRPSPATTAGPINPHTLRSFGRHSKDTQSFQPGSTCWLLYWPEEGVNPEYVPCVVVEVVDEEYVDVNLLGDYDVPQFLRAPISTLLEADSNFMHNDTAALDALNYPNVLETIRQRFDHAAVTEDKSFIYTYAGWILFAVNPYSRCDQIYDGMWCERYFRKTITQEPPHPFAIASIAYTKLIADHVPQYILISGESGGGKTECSKHILKYLTWVTWRQRRQRGRISVGGPADSAERLAQLLIEANPLLEFFGNAKTTRNDNSSRFGKLFQVYYDSNGEHLLSARLCTYLLAKSRVVQVPQGEENYHVFHSLMALESDTLKGLRLGDNFSSPFLGDNVAHTANAAYHDGGPFHISQLCDALTVFGISTCYQVCLFQVLSSILHLGNIEFVQKPKQQGVCVANPEVLAVVCELWGVEKEGLDGAIKRLETLLTSKQIRETRSLLTVSQCKHAVFALAKGLYEALFEYLVGIVRSVLSCTGAGEVIDEEYCIGVLDLFGFENMEPGSRNGFEQLCINYANEQLHHHFLREVVEKENQIYAAEGLVMVESAFGNVDQLVYSEALNVLLGSRNTPGVFNVLEDNCRMQQSRDPDLSFVRQVNQLLNSLRPPSPGKKRRMNADGSGGRLFTIHHFAEPVTYTADGFIDRNQDHISEEITRFLSTKTGGHIRVLFPLADESTPINISKKATVRSLSAVFIKQMSGLTYALEKTSCYFIKCLKPNDSQVPFEFDSGRVLRQLTTGGVGPVLELMTKGYPCRVTYDSLWQKFANYLPSDVIMKLDARNFAELTMSFLDLGHDEYRLGISRVFFRFGVLQKVEGILLGFDERMANRFRKEMHSWYKKHQFMRAVCAVMTLLRFSKQRFRHRKRKVMQELLEYSENVLKPRNAALKIQQWWRHAYVGYCVRRWYKRARRSTIRIQRWYRARLIVRQQKYHNYLSHSVKGVVAILTRFMERVVNGVDRKVNAAIRLQAWWRAVRTRNIIRVEFARVRIQRWWRRVRWGLRAGTRGRHRRFVKQDSVGTVAGATPVRSTASVSRLLRRGSMERSAVNPAFEEHRAILEMASKRPDIDRAKHLQDYKRSRISVFGNSVSRHFSPNLAATRLAFPKLHDENAKALIPRDHALQSSGIGTAEPQGLFAMPNRVELPDRIYKAPPLRSHTHEEPRVSGGQTPFAPLSVPGRTEVAAPITNECRPTPLPRPPTAQAQPNLARVSRPQVEDQRPPQRGPPPTFDRPAPQVVDRPVPLAFDRPAPPQAFDRPAPQATERPVPPLAGSLEGKRHGQVYRTKGFANHTVVSRQQDRLSDRNPPPPPPPPPPAGRTRTEQQLRKQSSLGATDSQRSSATGDTTRFYQTRAGRELAAGRQPSRDRFATRKVGRAPETGSGSNPNREVPSSLGSSEAVQSEPAVISQGGGARRQNSYSKPYQNFRPKLGTLNPESGPALPNNKTQEPPPFNRAQGPPPYNRSQEPPPQKKTQEPPSFNRSQEPLPQPPQQPTAPPPVSKPQPTVIGRSPVNLLIESRDEELERYLRTIEKPLDPPQSVVARLSLCRDDLNSKFERSRREARESLLARRDSLLPSEPSSILLDRDGVPPPYNPSSDNKENIPAGRLSVGDLPAKETKMGGNLCKSSADQALREAAKPMTTTTSVGDPMPTESDPMTLSHCRLSVNAWREQAERVEQCSPARAEGEAHPSTSGTEDAEDHEQTPLFGARDDEKIPRVLQMEPVGGSKVEYVAQPSTNHNEKENTPRPFQLSSGPQSQILSQHSRQSSNAQKRDPIKPGSSAVLATHTRQASNARKQSGNIGRPGQFGRQGSSGQQQGYNHSGNNPPVRQGPANHLHHVRQASNSSNQPLPVRGHVRQASNSSNQPLPLRGHARQASNSSNQPPPRGHYRTGSGVGGRGVARRNEGRPHAYYPVPVSLQADRDQKVKVPSLGQPSRRGKIIVTIKETDRVDIPGYGDRIPSRANDGEILRIFTRPRPPARV